MLKTFILTGIGALVLTFVALLWRMYDENLASTLLLYPFLKIRETVSPHVIQTPEGSFREGTPLTFIFSLLGLAANVVAVWAVAFGACVLRSRSRETGT